ncbi:GntR family transcriptional regulator [Luteipulveratus mongoliensis]|uniref:HTH gntR-type domain-containing protein n=1 Tax=Luteipulveratus mongoliensis TaxID=571913 RepID=A0A0K1JN18_9MICO|nr:GntR family transcriptional regulator [Luteipulveratus mongoliensis]AKU18101.1 hypothetical protein VV02_23260 [Luteipulveratus mongoliensis]
MSPQRTPVSGPRYLAIADDLRMQIERHELRPGDVLPSLAELCEQYGVSQSSARDAIRLLTAQALITTRNGARPTVRERPTPITYSNVTLDEEKALVRAPERTRRARGALEATTGVSIRDKDTDFSAAYTRTQAGPDEPFTEGTELLRREYETRRHSDGRLLAWSVSSIPVDLIESNPDLLDQSTEPWPGGTQHQLSTVGIEIARSVATITARAATTVELSAWGMAPSEPMLVVDGQMIDTEGRTVLSGQVNYPADRSRLEYVTDLTPWEH